MANEVEEFNAYRKKMNTKILAENNTVIKRIFNLDTNAFQEGALNTETKELLGLWPLLFYAVMIVCATI